MINLNRIHLFARPGFLIGVARVMDLGATLTSYNQSRTPKEADYYAMLSDWQAVGDDLWQAIDVLKDEALEQDTDE